MQFGELSYSQGKHKGVLKMSPRQKILAIRLTERLAKNPDYARTIGVEISDKIDRKGNKENSFAESTDNYG